MSEEPTPPKVDFASLCREGRARWRTYAAIRGQDERPEAQRHAISARLCYHLHECVACREATPGDLLTVFDRLAVRWARHGVVEAEIPEGLL